MEPHDHDLGQRTSFVEHLGDLCASAEKLRKLCASELPLIHAKLDRFDGRRWIDRMMDALVSVEEGREHVQFVELGRSRLRREDLVDPS